MKKYLRAKLVSKMHALMLPICVSFISVFLGAQQLDIQGATTGTDTVAKIQVNSSEVGAIGLHVHSANSTAIDAYSKYQTAIYGESTNELGVYGKSSNWHGVYGQSVSKYGVYGSSTNSHGVYGRSTNHFGVYGYSVNSYAGYFSGEVKVTQKLEAESAKVMNMLEVGSFNISYYEIVDHDSNVETTTDMGAHAYCALAYFKIRGATGTNRYAKVEFLSGSWYLTVRAESPALEVSAGCYCID